MIVSSFLSELPHHAGVLADYQAGLSDLASGFRPLGAAVVEPSAHLDFLSKTNPALLLSLATEGKIIRKRPMSSM